MRAGGGWGVLEGLLVPLPRPRGHAAAFFCPSAATADPRVNAAAYFTLCRIYKRGRQQHQDACKPIVTYSINTSSLNKVDSGNSVFLFRPLLFSSVSKHLFPGCLIQILM